MSYQLSKDYDSDWAKEKSRDLVGKMLDETILTFRKPKEVKVLHFGGVDLTEARQVYLPKGILPQNIVSVERERDVAEAQKKLGLGVQVVNSTLDEYLEEQQELDFDIISLDYIGPMSSQTISHLSKVRERQKRNTFLLHCANLLRREGEQTQRLYHMGFCYGQRKDALLTKTDLFSEITPMVERAKKLLSKSENGERLDEEKSTAYSVNIESTMAGLSQKDLLRLFNFVAGSRLEECKSLISQIFSKTIGETKALQWEDIKNNTFFLHILYNSLTPILGAQQENSGIPKGRELALLSILEDAVRGRFFIKREHNRYSYVSESGAPMVGDVFLMNYPIQRVNSALSVARHLGYPTQFRIQDIQTLCRKVIDYFREYEKQNVPTDTNPHIYGTDRQFLGNSSKPILTKRRFIEELESGKPQSQIEQEYRGWTKKPLSQWHAHFTMGTYKSQRMAEHNGDDCDIERITETEAKELLASGIPPKEIHEVYPTSFTIPQLGAFKAWQTMRSKSQEQQQ